MAPLPPLTAPMAEMMGSTHQAIPKTKRIGHHRKRKYPIF